MKHIIKYAYENTSFYRNSMKEKGFHPNDFNNISDLSKLPILTKNEIQSTSLDSFLSGSLSSNSVKRTTSGSTGSPLTVYLDRSTELQDNLEWTRAFFSNGMTIFDKMAVISDPRYFPTKRFTEYLGFMRRKYISIFEKSDSQLEKLIEFKPEVIRGYPSNLIIMLRENPQLVEKISPRIIFTSGELIDKNMREIISSSFNSEHYDFYVSNEFSQIAWECRNHEGYHINADSKYVEIIKEGEIAAKGESGEVVVTRMNNPLMPLIRYKIGDIGKMLDEQCSCGVKFPLLEMVEGRTDDLMITAEGHIVTPLIFFPYPFKNIKGVSQFRVIQESKDKIILEIVADMSFQKNTEELTQARKAIRDVFGESIEVEFSFVNEIEPEPSGKIKKIVSKVKVPI